ncbi:MAG: tRNA uridine-5-carboxymethylaminomethyl(34) synthesis enzyme MnmG [Candidatus Omnitrophica bacterium]|nr:tRNA uridine-5-carboxymethylaminomethyl(34) synthesis enzyme MnmG [Candidatus Omnitrophota bacterium]
MSNYDVIIIGAGHAAIEAAFAASRMGCRVLMLTLDAASIGLMSCNPAIGGVGKGQLVKEIDALGGAMGKAADACAIQFRILNASKGAAVHSSRAQIDMDRYNRYMSELVSRQENLAVKQAEVKKLLVKKAEAYGVVTATGEEITAKCVVISAGTFLEGLIHVGLKHYSGGRINEPAANDLTADLRRIGFNLLRFKTGTCSRLDKNTIDFSKLTVQNGDEVPVPFSFSTQEIKREQVPCHITYTNNDTHRIIRDNLDKSPLYAGIIKAQGVRYCPSIEDKVVKFADRERHQIFLEPQGLDTDLVYPNGLSTSLPEDVQLDLIHSIEGLEKAKVIRFGYGIEHTVVEPTQIRPTLEAKSVRNLYFAGQINGTTGYEEAAAQGLIAGINAALRVKSKEPFILDRASSYTGVLIDDLTTKGTDEPYRMFTSRVEYRLILREDNADLRLRKYGFDLGLVTKEEYENTKRKEEAIKRGIGIFKATRIKPSAEVNLRLEAMGTAAIKRPATLEEILKRPQVSVKDLKNLDHLEMDLTDSALRECEIEVKYSGFIRRQLRDVERFKNLEKIRLPEELDYDGIACLSREIREKLKKFRPLNLGQASRISGVTPAAVSLLMVYLKNLDG